MAAFKVGDRVDHIDGLFKDREVVFSDKDIWYHLHTDKDMSRKIWHHSWLTESKESRVLNILRQWKESSK